ncbi:extracellular solute-binding protein [Rhodococcus sp. WB9]|uniref:ABC transporter substrate-binding protein n=1 Tax=Rhodococcus sp. WB9 TaxID=2594007 RepID=UPI0011858A96|nr:extracellular solute-binding protein [Rhodococcus sp. WB9]QDQ95904.1 extracellular solute-binding protein [Rhodococcus sp. WB9]
MRSFGMLTVITAVAFAGVACGQTDSSTGPVQGSWDDVVAAAKKEGAVQLYSSQHPANLEALKEAWSKAYPEIDLEFVRGTDKDMIPRVEVENRTGQAVADVNTLTDAAWINNAAVSGQFSTDLVGPAFDNPDYRPQTNIKNNRFFLTTAATFGMGWNTDAYPDGFKTPTDLLKPELEGRIGIVNPVGIASYIDLYDFYAKTYGSDYLEKLAALHPRIYPSALGISQALNSGEIVATPTVQPLVREVAVGAPVDWVLPQVPWGTPFYSHVLSVAPHPNAAQVLANFLATPEGQTALATGNATALPSIPGAVAYAGDIHTPDATKLTPEAVEKGSVQWEKLFQQ